MKSIQPDATSELSGAMQKMVGSAGYQNMLRAALPNPSWSLAMKDKDRTKELGFLRVSLGEGIYEYRDDPEGAAAGGLAGF